MYFGKKSNLLSILYRIPSFKDKRAHYSLANILVRYLIFAGLVSTIMWILINNSEFYRSIHNYLVIYGILFSGTFVIMYNYYKSNYKKYLTL